MKKCIFRLLLVLILMGCRSTKPTASYETLADSLTVSSDSSFSLRHDSTSISVRTRNMTEDIIKFVDGGGAIHISSNGSVALSGVAGVRYSNSSNSERRKTKGSLNLRSQTKDSIAVSYQSISHAETKPATSFAISAYKLKIAFLLFSLLILIIVIAKIKTNKL